MDIELRNDRIPRNPFDRQFLDMRDCTNNLSHLSTRRHGFLLCCDASKVTITMQMQLMYGPGRTCHIPLPEFYALFAFVEYLLVMLQMKVIKKSYVYK